MSAAEYLVAQQAYAGWSLAGIAVVGALVSTSCFAWITRDLHTVFPLAVAALLCTVATQVMFWTLNFPANQATSNWTVLPHNWQSWRLRWEFGHAMSCLLNLAALTCLHAANFRLLRH